MQHSFHMGLVALSFAVAVTVAYVAFYLASRVASSRGSAGTLWLAGGALALGSGIWAMHFIGMLAWKAPIPLAYDPWLTLLSLAAAAQACGYGLKLASTASPSWRAILHSGVVMGAGIGAMHYLGMLAITVVPHLHFEWHWVAASLLVAVLASTLATALVTRLRDHTTGRQRLARGGAAVIMGTAIAGMHYVGMVAVSFAPGAWCLAGFRLDPVWFAGVLAAIAFTILATTGALMIIDAHMTSRTRLHARQLAEAYERLRHTALHDGLTGLPNRTLLHERLDALIVSAALDGTRFAVMIVDLDRFKSVNDSLGHHAGDELLRQIAARVSAALSPGDLLARMGGDEFVVLREAVGDINEVELLAQSIQGAIAPVIFIEGADMQVTCSTGIALYPDAGRDAATLLRNADAAMYHVKNSGRQQHCFYQPQMGRFARERLDIENGLRHALVDEQFVLNYQPRVDVASGRICGAEALSRWNHPMRGLIPPAAFIPIAEETGLILPIGRWAVRTALRQLRAWQDAGMNPLRLSVNLSAEQLCHPGLERVVMDALREFEIDPSLLELELTESAVMRDPETSVQALRNLVKRGVHVSVDDFGTGYSSLNYLRRLPLHVLKIDRSFIRDVVTNHEDAEITRAIISLAHSLKLKVTAEGVETERQLAFIRALGCDEYQGFLFSPALAPEAFAQLVLASQSMTQRMRTLGRVRASVG
jgi:diguanylate cyclase (GGDEF)-like protein